MPAETVGEVDEVSVVVTGSAGFIGRHVVAALVGDGLDVVGIDRAADASSPARHLQGDLTDEHPQVSAALRRARAVIHLAGCPGVRDVGPDVGRRRYRDNVLALRRVLDRVRADVPVLVASSSSVYGGTQAGRGCREDDVLAPRGGYARSKVLAEALCRRVQDAGAAVTVVRPFTVVGEGQRPDMALHRWVQAACSGQPLVVLGAPTRTRDLTDVRFVARALVDLVAMAPGGVVNVGSGRAVSLAEMVATVASVTGAEPVVRRLPAEAEEVADTLADVHRLVELTGRRPQTDLADVVARVRDDLAERGLLARARVGAAG